MKFLDGLKTIVGLVGVVATTVIPAIAPIVTEVGMHAVGIAQGIFGALAALGVVHKAEKIREAKQFYTNRDQ